MNLTDNQRAILDALAHMRVVPEDAWQTTRQLSRFTSDRRYDATYRAAVTLWQARMIRRRTFPNGHVQWKITQAGREAL